MKLVIMSNNEIFTTSLAISEGVGVQHHSVFKLIKNHSHTEILNGFQIHKLSTKGRPVEVIYLTELQATFLITLMKNTPKVLKFKQKLVKEFYKQRKLISQLLVQKQNAEWLEKRQESKTIRKELTDIIQEFVGYAKNQGSKSADKYYMNLSRMELTGLFLLEQKFPNAREVMSMRQLNLIEMADEAVAMSLKEGMDEGLHYKECYKKAKDKIQLLSKIFPPSPLPALLGVNN